jgi:hypothetical protein
MKVSGEEFVRLQVREPVSLVGEPENSASRVSIYLEK